MFSSPWAEYNGTEYCTARDVGELTPDCYGDLGVNFYDRVSGYRYQSDGTRYVDLAVEICRSPSRQCGTSASGAYASWWLWPNSVADSPTGYGDLYSGGSACPGRDDLCGGSQFSGTFELSGGAGLEQLDISLVFGQWVRTFRYDLTTNRNDFLDYTSGTVHQ